MRLDRRTGQGPANPTEMTVSSASRTFAAFSTFTGIATLAAGCAPDAAPLRSTNGIPDASARLLAEVGFFNVPPQPTAAIYPARLFYVFEPADTEAEARPLVVFFNGGPGFATSAGLLSFGTGRRTVDLAADAGTTASDNEARWTRFANLLYIDARQTGFSYGLGALGDAGTAISEFEDASDFVRAVLDFLDGHEALRKSPVILAGESYGGVRATAMLDLLLRYPTEASRGGADLERRIQAHYDLAFPERAGTVLDPATAARQFGAQVLIQPAVLAGQFSLQYLAPASAYADGSVDPENALEPVGWSDTLVSRALQVLADPVQSARLIGSPFDEVALMQPSARTGAFHEDDVSDFAGDAGLSNALNQALSSQLGPLSARDRYFALNVSARVPALAAPIGDDFIENLRTVKTFITNARNDLVVYSPAIPSLLGATIDSSPQPGVARPGSFRVSLPATDGGEPAQSVTVRFPTYEQSGHMVAASQPADLAADVQAWWSAR
jgi:hypothetical protein